MHAIERKTTAHMCLRCSAKHTVVAPAGKHYAVRAHASMTTSSIVLALWVSLWAQS